MPQKSTENVSPFLFRDEADRLLKCQQLIALIDEKQKARRSKSTVVLKLTAEQLEFIEYCINTEFCAIISATEKDLYGADDEEE